MYKTHLAGWGARRNRGKNTNRVQVHQYANRTKRRIIQANRIVDSVVSPKRALNYSERTRESIVNSGLPGAPRANERSSLMRGPGELTTPERMFVLLRNHCRGSFNSGTWNDDEPKPGCYTTKVHFNAREPLAMLYDHCFWHVNFSLKVIILRQDKF